jgi:putative ATPase
MLIFASEDVGNANANALLLANATFDAVSKIGYPESRIILSQCATYLASSPKSNASYEAIGKALQLVNEKGDLPVPLHLRNAPTKMMKQMDYGKEYKYAHHYEHNFVLQEFLPSEIAGTQFYSPQKNTKEDEFTLVKREGSTSFIASVAAENTRGMYFWESQNQLFVAVNDDIYI